MFSSNPTVDTKYPLAPKCSPVKFLRQSPNFRAIWIALFPFRYPTTFDSAFFGAMLKHIWTWSPIRCPSTTFDSLCLAYSWNISPSWLRNTPKIRFLRRFGIITTWYLQSHLVWLKLWYSFIVNLLSLGRDQKFTPTVVKVKPRWVPRQSRGLTSMSYFA
jgi:hypothetical protein